jgi:DUF1680 family protein
MSLSRRTFSGLLAAPALLAADLEAQEQRRGTIPDVPPFEGALTFTRQPAAARIRPFAMTEVRLLDGPFKDAEDWNRAYMQRLPADRLLHNFRVNAGLPSSAEPFGGWEEPKGELRGHFTGHYLSGAALLYASTGDADIKTKADYMVAELAKCQEKLGGGYLSAFPLEFWTRLDARQKVWAPFYTIHKIMAGMFDMYSLAGNQQALDVLKGMAGWADTWTASKSEAHMQEILQTEYGGMNEVLYNLAAATNDDRWAAVGDRFTKKVFFNPLASRRDELRGLHVNTHIPQVIGAARRYELSSDERFHDVADFFWYEVVSARAYVTGGTSNGEGWLTPPRQLAAELKRSVATAECCCAYNMLKLTRHLYGWTGDPRYFDYYERVMLNHRLGTIYPKTGATQYYLSLTPGTWKTFGTEDHSFWCCTGTGVEEYSKLNDSIYWQDDKGLLVNLFIPSELDWKEKGIRLRQTTQFPTQPSTLLSFAVDKPAQLSVRIRVPAWVADGASVKLNGKTLEASPTPGSYFTLNRVWKNGDRIELQMPMRLHKESMPDDPKLQAFLYGPLVLAGDLGAEGLKPEMLVGPNAPRLNSAPHLEIPQLKFEDIQASPKPLTFHAANVELTPLNSLFDKRYTVYFHEA